MYSVANDWVQVINQTRVSNLVDGVYQPILPIEPDTLFTHNTIAVYVRSQNAKPNWYRGGNLYQAFLVPFGTAGAAQGEELEVVLNRYMIHRFTTFPDYSDNQYIISYTPPPYFKDVQLQVWEYRGTNQGVSNEDLDQLQKQALQRLARIQTTVNRIDRKT